MMFVHTCKCSSWLLMLNLSCRVVMPATSLLRIPSLLSKADLQGRGEHLRCSEGKATTRQVLLLLLSLAIKQ